MKILQAFGGGKLGKSICRQERKCCCIAMAVLTLSRSLFSKEVDGNISWRPNASMYKKIFSNQTVTMKDKETSSRSSIFGETICDKVLTSCHRWAIDSSYGVFDFDAFFYRSLANTIEHKRPPSRYQSSISEAE